MRIKGDALIQDLKEENARLRAELEALKPKPVETCVYLNISGPNFMSWGHCSASTGHNLKLTFEDDKLVKAEII